MKSKISITVTQYGRQVMHREVSSIQVGMETAAAILELYPSYHVSVSDLRGRNYFHIHNAKGGQVR